MNLKLCFTDAMIVIISFHLFSCFDSKKSMKEEQVEEDVKVDSVRLNKKSLAIEVGSLDTTLIATVYPENATNKNVIWGSINSSVATVDKDGTITGVAEGESMIIVTTEDGKKTDVCVVSVTKKCIKVDSVRLSAKSLMLETDADTTLTVIIYPDDATNKNVTWENINSSVATFDETSGKITAISPGQDTLVVTTDDGGKTDTCILTIIQKNIAVDSVRLKKKSLILNVNANATLTATIYPEDATNKDVTWQSTNPSIAEVDDNGNVKTKEQGEVSIIVTTTDGEKTDTCVVKVCTDLIIPHLFSVSDTKKVMFTKGNLWWDGEEFQFEEKQTEFYSTEWHGDHVNLFYWTTDPTKSYVKTEFDATGISKEDHFFADGSDDQHKLTVAGVDGLYVLTNDEWCYLLSKNTSSININIPKRKGKWKLGVKVDDTVEYCLIIAPDDFEGTLKDSYTLKEVDSLGLVCLIYTSYRTGMNCIHYGDPNTEIYGYYWTASPKRENTAESEKYAGEVSFCGKGINGGWPVGPMVGFAYRRQGRAIRLVKDAE